VLSADCAFDTRNRNAKLAARSECCKGLKSRERTIIRADTVSKVSTTVSKRVQEGSACTVAAAIAPRDHRNDLYPPAAASKFLELIVTEADQITELLKNAKTIAVVGLSNNPMRAAYGVSAYMQSQGYRIIPVNPEADEVLGEKAYPSVSAIPEPVDVVDIFRRSEFVGPIVDDAMQKGVKNVWMQETVIDEEAAQKARDQGIFVVMDRCILKEHRKRSR
jgi:uncharacterized protein